VVHRDVKPENILLEDGHAWLADFGIARTLDAVGVATLTSAGIAVGTPAYMSPEQASGARDVDGRTDSFALTCVLYEALAGVPPYVGATAQSVIAQRFAHAPHPITSYRPGLSPTVTAAVDGGLRMVAADRLTAAELRDLLRSELTSDRAPHSGWSEAVPAPGAPARSTDGATRSVTSDTQAPQGAGAATGTTWRWRVLALVALLTLLALPAALSWRRSGAVAGDPATIAVFPLQPASPADASPEQVAGMPILLASTLEGVPPLRWIEGDRIEGFEAGQDPAASHRLAARRAGAGHFVDGTVFARGDSVRVVLRLVSTASDSVVARSAVTRSGGVRSAAVIALRAVGPLLVPLLDPGRSSTIAPLTERDPVAVGAFLAGERAYRRAQYDEALGHYERALAADSQLAIAALKGARAARSLFREADQVRLLAAALAHERFLPEAHAAFARGLRFLQRRDADSAVLALERAAALVPHWADVHATLGDVHLTVGRDDVRADSAARSHYERAVQADSTFALPHYHLAWLAVLRGDADGAEAALAAYRRADPRPSAFVDAVPAAATCLRSGPDAVTWSTVGIEARVVAGKLLIGGGSHLPCAHAAFTSAFAESGGLTRNHFSALLGLNAVAVARGDSAALAALAADPKARALRVRNLLLFDAAIGAPVSDLSLDAGAMLNDRETLAAEELWVLGAWLFARGETTSARRVTELLDRRTGAEAEAMARSLRARVALLDGDTASARRLLAERSPLPNIPQVEWMLFHAGTADDVLLAQLELARAPAKARRLAARADHPYPLVNVLLLPSSLAVRADAARRLGDVLAERSLTERLSALHAVERQ
jgi:serine/threonine-protein kinase